MDLITSQKQGLSSAEKQFLKELREKKQMLPAFKAKIEQVPDPPPRNAAARFLMRAMFLLYSCATSQRSCSGSRRRRPTPSANGTSRRSSPSSRKNILYAVSRVRVVCVSCRWSRCVRVVSCETRAFAP